MMQTDGLHNAIYACEKNSRKHLLFLPDMYFGASPTKWDNISPQLLKVSHGTDDYLIKGTQPVTIIVP